MISEDFRKIHFDWKSGYNCKNEDRNVDNLLYSFEARKVMMNLWCYYVVSEPRSYYFSIIPLFVYWRKKKLTLVSEWISHFRRFRWPKYTTHLGCIYRMDIRKEQGARCPSSKDFAH